MVRIKATEEELKERKRLRGIAYREKNKEKLQAQRDAKKEEKAAYAREYRKRKGFKEKDAEYRRSKYWEKEAEKGRTKDSRAKELKANEEKRRSEGKYILSEDQKEASRKQASEWQANNRDKVRLKNSLSKPHVKQATPKSVERETLLKFYTNAVGMEDIAGEKYHVDHIIPIRHDKICGLNVPRNLQVIPASDNIKKSNSFEPYSIEH